MSIYLDAIYLFTSKIKTIYLDKGAFVDGLMAGGNGGIDDAGIIVVNVYSWTSLLFLFPIESSLQVVCKHQNYH